MIPAKGRSAQHDPCQAHQSTPRQATLSRRSTKRYTLKQALVARVARPANVARWCYKAWKHGVVARVAPKSALARIGASLPTVTAACASHVYENTCYTCYTCYKCYKQEVLGVARSVAGTCLGATNRGSV